MSNLNRGCNFENPASKEVFMYYVPAMSGSIAASLAYGAAELANADEAVTIGSSAAAAIVGIVAVRKLFGLMYDSLDGINQ